MIINQGKDTTLDPYYFAKPITNATSGTGNGDTAALEKKIKEHETKIAQLTDEYNKLEKDSEEAKEKLSEITKEMNKMFSSQEEQDKKIEELEVKINSIDTGNFEPISNEFINNLEFEEEGE